MYYFNINNSIRSTVFLFLLALLLPVLRVLFINLNFHIESADKSVLIVAMSLVVFFLCFKMNLRFFSSNIKIFQAIFLIEILISISWITPLKGFETNYWWGFGLKITLFAIIISPILIFVISNLNLNFVKNLNYLIVIPIVAIYSFSILQPPWAVHDYAGHTQYVVNEILAPSNGNFPFFSFHPQYTSLLGYLYVPINKIYSGPNTVIYFLGFLQIFTIFLVIYTICRINFKLSWLIILATVPGIFIVKSSNIGFSGTISSLFSNIPVRLIFPAMIFFYFVSFSGRFKNKDLIILTILSTLAILNNFESGFVVSIVSCVLYYLINYKGDKYKSFIYSFTIIFIPITTLGVFLVFKNLSLQSFAPFVFGFGSGFGSVPMPNFGLWIFIFCYLSYCSYVGAQIFFNARKISIENQSQIKKIAMILFFWGTFGLGMSPYYLNRSIVSGQLQFIICITFFATSGLLLFVISRKLSFLFKVILLLPTCVSIASLLNAPNPMIEFKRLENKSLDIKAIYDQEIKEINKYIMTNKVDKKKSGILMNFGEIYSDSLSIKSYLIVNSFSDFTFINLKFNDVCYKLKTTNVLFTKSLSDEITNKIEECFHKKTSLMSGQVSEIIVFERNVK